MANQDGQRPTPENLDSLDSLDSLAFALPNVRNGGFDDTPRNCSARSIHRRLPARAGAADRAQQPRERPTSRQQARAQASPEVPAAGERRPVFADRLTVGGDAPPVIGLSEPAFRQI